MNIQNIPVTDIVIALIPVLSAICAWAYQYVLQRMPAQQRASLQQFAQMAANKVEQVYPNAGSINKKQLATQLIEDIFKAFKLPIPDQRVIDAALESAVLAINQSQALADPYGTTKLSNTVSTTTSITGPVISKVLGPEPIILPPETIILKTDTNDQQTQDQAQIAGDAHETT